MKARWMIRKTLSSFAVASLLAACSGPDQDPDDHHHDVENHHAADATNAHTHESDGDRDGGHDDHDHGHEGDAESADLGADVTISPEAESYCECMLVNCHDPFHDEWGDSDPEAIANCETEASRQDGAVLQCWQTNCESIDADGVTCAEALGEGC